MATISAELSAQHQERSGNPARLTASVMRTHCALMKTPFVAALIVLAAISVGVAGDAKAEAIANSVLKASGGENWPKVKRIHFTFNVERDGKPALSAKHDWDLVKQADTITWNGKTVTVNLAQPASDADGKEAFQRWTNDSYWLLAPLKLRDPGTNLRLLPQTPETKEDVDVLELTFGSVGLTPNDKYNLYIDRNTHL